MKRAYIIKKYTGKFRVKAKTVEEIKDAIANNIERCPIYGTQSTMNIDRFAMACSYMLFLAKLNKIGAHLCPVTPGLIVIEFFNENDAEKFDIIVRRSKSFKLVTHEELSETKHRLFNINGES